MTTGSNLQLWSGHRPLSDRETAKAPDLDTVSAHQCVAHGLKNGCDCKISITRCQLTEPRKEKFDEVRSVHAQRNYLTVFSRCIFLQTCAASSEYAIPFFLGKLWIFLPTHALRRLQRVPAS